MDERAHAQLDFEEPEPPLPRRGRQRAPRWRGPAGIAAAAVAVTAAAVGVVLAVHGGTPSKSAAGSSPAVPAQVYVRGTLDLSFGTNFAPNASDPEPGRTAGPRIGDPCSMLGGYDDINQGVAVTIGDGAGKTLVVTALSAGSVAGDANQALCEFSFSANVPAGRGTYTVTISHRGTQVFTEAQVQDPIQLSLGG